MSAEQIPLMKQTISMLTDKVDKIGDKVEEEARKAQAHREESIKFHAELLEKLDTRFAWKWTEKIIVFIGSAIWISLIGAIMALVLINPK